MKESSTVIESVTFSPAADGTRNVNSCNKLNMMQGIITFRIKYNDFLFSVRLNLKA